MSIDILKKKIAEFRPEDFGVGITREMQSSVRPRKTPPVFPTVGEHPRLLFKKADLPKIRATMDKERAKEAAAMVREFAERECDGKLPEAYMHDNGYPFEPGRRGVYNYDAEHLAVIQSKAFTYQLTGDERYGYEAIYAMLNCLLTFDTHWLTGDAYREYGHVAFIAACVYDWCYDLMDENTKLCIITGSEHKCYSGDLSDPEGARKCGKAPCKMEIGFPPDRQAAVTGHGSELQLQRDYLASAIAFYDELPGWWDYIGGRYYDEFVPVRREFYKGEMYPQGVAFYAQFRYIGDLFAMWLLKAMTGELPFPECNREVMRALVNHEAGTNQIYATGDGGGGIAQFFNMFVAEAMISAYLFDDSVMYGFCKEYGYGFSEPLMSPTGILPVEMVICHSGTDDICENFREGLDNMQYTGGYLGQLITHNKRGFDAASTLLKIAPRTTANHDHLCAGSFLIYYKGMLSTCTGGYMRYGSDHWAYYHQATVAHNSLLVFDPAKHESEAQIDQYGRIANGAAYWYTGGQVRPWHEAQSYEEWMGPTYEKGKVTGVKFDRAKRPRYGYLAGDITKAYPEETVDFIERKMLTVYPSSEKIPMLLFVQDRIDAKSPDFKKTFTLQMSGRNEPRIEKNRVSVDNGTGGTLVLNTLIGGDEVVGIGGGVGKNYLINGNQCADSSFAERYSWGRIEVSPKRGSASDVLLNLLYVKDTGCDYEPEIKTVRSECGRLVGAMAEGALALFNTEREKLADSFKFTVEEDFTGCYIAGLSEGTWQVTRNGSPTYTVKIADTESFMEFLCDAGEIEIKML